MTASMRLLLVGATLCTATAWGQSGRTEPHIGYVYPSGGRRGTTLEVVVGGQNLRGANGVFVSGTGVHASVVQFYRPVRNIDREQREALQKRLKELFEMRRAELAQRDGAPAPSPGSKPATPKKNAIKPKAANKGEPAASQPVALPEHPLLRNLENKSLQELEHVRYQLLNMRNRQPNVQIAESVVLRISIDANAAPGDREIRLGNPGGLTNPMCFQVGLYPESRELEPNNPQIVATVPELPPYELPFLINGQIQPGDVDRFRFGARQGQKLVIEARARHLIPYLADAVPGWFQATMAVYDARGKEVAYVDDYRFDPDPVLFYEVPEDGEYAVEIRDSIYRGREDFVYRISVGEQPFITEAFPLGGRTGARTVASIDGWNLPSNRLPLGTPLGPTRIRQTGLCEKESLSNRVTYAVDMLPESSETEPNDTPENAQRIDPPRIVNGRIAGPGDVDVYQFKGRPGEEIVAEVYARRLRSPLDSLLRVIDASGQVLAWNDDHEDKETGLLTHHADSYVRVRLISHGVYYVQVSDAQRHGGEAYGYRVRIGAPQPDFALRVSPSSINVRAGGAAAVCVHVVRKDGFDGEIEVLLKDPSAGFTLGGSRIPKGCDRVRMTLAAPPKPLDRPMVLELEAQAQIRGLTIRRPVVPAEDMMQAFLYRHLAPSQQLMVATIGPGRPGPPIELADEGPVRLPAGGTAKVRVRAPKGPMLQNIHFELREPPEGVVLQNVTVVPEGLALVLKADRTAAKVGLADNLIVEAFVEQAGGQQAGKGRKQNDRSSLGVLPAIPIEITQQ